MSGVLQIGPGFRFAWGQREDLISKMPQRPGRRMMDGGVQANETLLRGLYHGTAVGWQFASPLCFVPINLLVQMMGYPTPIAKDADETTQAALDYIVAEMAEKISRLHRGALVVGNAWRWPKFNANLQDSKGNPGRLIWEAIPDSTIPDILIDVQSEEAVALLTDEMITSKTGENRTATVERKRRFDASSVEVRYLGERPTGAEDYIEANVAGMLPINFANDADEGEIRGSSQFGRALRILKDYHDAAYRISETLTKFTVKQVQSVESPSTWREENGLVTDADFANFSPAENDFVLNRKGESTDYKFLAADATKALEDALQRDFYLIVEATGIPELFWGPLATGNHASTDTQMDQAVAFAKSKRDEFSPSWKNLFAGSLRVLSIARGETYRDFDMGWNRLESVSAAVKSEIMLRFSQMAAQLVNSATCTKKQLHRLWELNFPESEPGEFEEWEAGINEMVLHKQALGMDALSGLDDFTKKTPPKGDQE